MEGATLSPLLIFSPFLQWKPEYTSSDRLLLAISVSVIIMINLTVMCLVEVSR